MRSYWGKVVKDRRLELGMSVDKLAQKADVSINSVKNIEAGDANPTVDLLEKVLNALHFDLEVVDAVYGNISPLAVVREPA